MPFMKGGRATGNLLTSPRHSGGVSQVGANERVEVTIQHVLHLYRQYNVGLPLVVQYTQHMA